VHQANSWPRAQRPPDDPCIWLSIDELRRADIMRPSWHLVRTFCPVHPVAAGCISLIRSDADLVDRGKEWIRFRYVLTDPRTGRQRQVDRRVILARTADGRWWFVIGGQLHQQLCLVHVDEHFNCAQGNRATTDCAQPPAKVTQERVSEPTRKRFLIMAKLAKAKTAAARFLVSLFDFRLWPTALSWLARAMGERFPRLIVVRWGRRTHYHSPHSAGAAGEPQSTNTAAAVESTQTGWSVAARAVPVRPVDIRAKPHEPAPTIRPPPPRRVAKMDRSGSRSRAEQAPRRKVRREPVEPRENAPGCAPAKTLPSGTGNDGSRLCGPDSQESAHKRPSFRLLAS
jgi:hypothetical protein